MGFWDLSAVRELVVKAVCGGFGASMCSIVIGVCSFWSHVSISIVLWESSWWRSRIIVHRLCICSVGFCLLSIMVWCCSKARGYVLGFSSLSMI